MRIILILTSCFLVSFSTLGARLDLADNVPSKKKEQYCETLVNRHGHWSFRLNDSFRGEGVEKPSRNSWKLVRSKKPGWFSKDLYYIFEQTTKDGFTHTAFCHWDKNGFLLFKIVDETYGAGVLLCGTPNQPSC